MGWFGQSSEVSFPNHEVRAGSAACSASSQCFPGWKMTAGVLAFGFSAALMPARSSSAKLAVKPGADTFSASMVIIDWMPQSGRISCHAAAAILAWFSVIVGVESVKRLAPLALLTERLID